MATVDPAHARGNHGEPAEPGDGYGGGDSAAGGAAITVGSVAFHLDSAAGTVLGTDANGADGFTFSSASSTISPLGAHTVYAVYLGGSSGATNYTTSTSAPASFTLPAATGANPDVQNIETSIDQGTILISTPYNATAPLVVPQLTLTTVRPADLHR